MTKNINIILSLLLVFISLNGRAQESGLSGKVVDRLGNPAEGVLVSVAGSEQAVVTGKDGVFSIIAREGDMLRVFSAEHGTVVVPVEIVEPFVVKMGYGATAMDRGYGLPQTMSESTGAVSVTTHENLDKRSSINISNSLFGNALGLTALQNSGNIWDNAPTFYIRGLQSLSDNSVLVLVDGFQRDIQYIVPEEVESVFVLRDASALAIYGYKGINGAVLITTKRGKHNSREINVSYDHAFIRQIRLPKFVDSYTYASAINEALVNDGYEERYLSHELNAFKSGQYPYLYPNVDWFDEVFRPDGFSNIYNVNFRGGGMRVRYYTMLNLQGNKGFVNNAGSNSGYSTQHIYSQGNIRTNLDIALSPSTGFQINLMGMLREFNRPGLESDGLMTKLYMVPSAAFPVKTDDGIWGGNETWGSQYNPVALVQDRGYSRGHHRLLYGDLKLTQNLDVITKGLNTSVRVGYDNIAAYWEGHTKDYAWASDVVSSWKVGAPHQTTRISGGSDDTELDYSSSLDWQNRYFNFVANVDYRRESGINSVFAMLSYSYESRVENGQHNNRYRQNAVFYAHYGHKNRYFTDVTLTLSGSNKIAPSKKWGLSGAIGVSWLLSNEDFLKGSSMVDLLKLRASFGIIQSDNIPQENYWKQGFESGGSYYLGSGYGSYSGMYEGRLAPENSSREKGIKYNIGADASLLKGLTLAADGFFERRKDIWVSSAGKTSAVLGAGTPYASEGIVDSWGFEGGIDYNRKWNDFILSAGAKFTFATSEIVEQYEEAKPYDYLYSTGKPVGQLFGYQAMGFFTDQGEIDNSPVQQFGPVKPGDIKYKDQNGDEIINEYDYVAMGYNNVAPEIYFSFDLGIEWKGIGALASFQGVGRYTKVLSTAGMYVPLVDDYNISEHYYNNRWTSEKPFAKYPRLTTEYSDNNLRTNSVWLADASFVKLRNCELYYKIPSSVLQKLRLGSAKFYVRGVDLFSLDHIRESDPESTGATWPLTRSLNVGFNVSF